MAYNSQMYSNQFGTANTGYPIYNNGFTGINQPYYNQLPTTPPLILSAAYTKGEIGASSYPVASGNTVVLLDSDSIDTDNPIIYIKTTGYDGKPQTIRKITGTVSYPNEQGLFTVPTKDVDEQPKIDLSEYVRTDDINEVKENINVVNNRINEFEGTIKNLNENLNNIDDRLNNMFSAFNSNFNSGFNRNNNEDKKENHNNYSNKKKGGNN